MASQSFGPTTTPFIMSSGPRLPFDGLDYICSKFTIHDMEKATKAKKKGGLLLQGI